MAAQVVFRAADQQTVLESAGAAGARMAGRDEGGEALPDGTGGQDGCSGGRGPGVAEVFGLAGSQQDNVNRVGADSKDPPHLPQGPQGRFVQALGGPQGQVTHLAISWPGLP